MPTLPYKKLFLFICLIECNSKKEKDSNIFENNYGDSSKFLNIILISTNIHIVILLPGPRMVRSDFLKGFLSRQALWLEFVLHINVSKML